MREHTKIAEELLREIGGRDNVQSITHCVTRLRFILEDKTKANKETINHIKGVIAVMEKAGQFQVVIDNNVSDVYEEVVRLSKLVINDNSTLKIKKSINPFKNISKNKRKVILIDNPITGDVLALSKSKDAVHAEEALGKGVIIIPSEGQVFAPFDGKVSIMFHTGHALGLVSEDGVELLIHVGIDTVKLNGKYYIPLVDTGDNIMAGQLLLEFDIDKITAEGYEIETQIVISNTSDYKNIKVCRHGFTRAGNVILQADYIAGSK